MKLVALVALGGVVFGAGTAAKAQAQSFTLADTSERWTNITLNNNRTARFSDGSNGLRLNNTVFIDNPSESAQAGYALVGWGGVPSNGDTFQKSYYQYNGVGRSTVNVGQIFQLGAITHYNYPIIDPSAREVGLELKIHFSNPAVTQQFNLTLAHNETPNQPSSGICPAGDSVPCADIVTVPRAVASQNFVVDGRAFTLKFSGFSFNSNPNDFNFALTDEFISDEEKTNKAFLYGQIVEEPIPFELESALGLGLFGLWGAWTLRRRHKALQQQSVELAA